MPDVSKSAPGTVHGGTIVLKKVTIYFQIYPGISGTRKDRCISGAEYKVKAGDTVFFGSTGEDGSVRFSLPVGQTANLEIFDTAYSIGVKTDEIQMSGAGTKERLTILGYYTGAIDQT